MIFNIVSGQGSFATIKVTFPTGATCTCVKSPFSFTSSTSPATFSVPIAGIWKITVSSGDLTKSVSVDVTTFGTTYEEAIVLRQTLYNGESSSNTIEFRSSSGGTARINSFSYSPTGYALSLSGSDYPCWARTTSYIDLTSFTKLVITGDSRTYVGKTNTIYAELVNKEGSVVSLGKFGPGEGSHTYNIASRTGEFKLQIRAREWNDYGHVYSWYIE